MFLALPFAKGEDEREGFSSSRVASFQKYVFSADRLREPERLHRFFVIERVNR